MIEVTKETAKCYEDAIKIKSHINYLILVKIQYYYVSVCLICCQKATNLETNKKQWNFKKLSCFSHL